MVESRLMKINETPIGKSELVYCVTSEPENETFFCQLSKYPNEELLEFNDFVNQKSSELQHSNQVNELEVGQIVLAKYNEDECWYRAIVISKSEKKRRSVVRFIDYGNYEMIKYDKILRIADIEELKRPAFGILCRYDGIEEFPKEDRQKFYQILNTRYLLIRPTTKQEDNVWNVTIPRLGYNTHMWDTIDPMMQQRQTN